MDGTLIVIRRWVIGLVPATLIGVALLSMVGNPHPAAAQQGERLAVVSGYFDAQNRADVDESLSAFADNAVFIGVQATGERLIFTGKGDEQGVILNGVHHTGAVVVNPLFRDASAAQKMKHASIRGKFNCVQFNTRSPNMFYLS